MRVNNVDRVHHTVRTVALKWVSGLVVFEVRKIQYLLVSIGHLTYCYRNVQARKVCLCLGNLSGQRTWLQDVIVKRLGAKLQNSGDKFGFGIRVQYAQKVIAARLPFIIAIEAELEDTQSVVLWTVIDTYPNQ